MKKRITMLILTITLLLCVLPFAAFADVNSSPVAKVGDTGYETIDEAIAKWTNGTTLTLLSNVTLSDTIELYSTEHHILDLGTYTMTAASGKNAIEIIASGAGSSEKNAITIKADSSIPGGINAGSKSVIYYDYSKGTTTGDDRPIIKIEGGVFTGSTSTYGTVGIYFKGTASRKAATLNITGGEFNCSINGQGKSKLLISGGTFNYSVGSQGDSTAYRLISGGKFKSLGFMTADSNNTKFWFGTSMGNSNVGVYVDDNGYLVVGGPVITEPGDKFAASSDKYSGFSSYLKYSSAATNGLYYTSVSEALADNTGATDKVIIYKTEVDLSSSNYKGTITLPEGQEQITISFPEGTTPAWKIEEAKSGELRVFTQEIKDGKITRVYDAITPKIDGNGKITAAVPNESGKYALTAESDAGYWFVGWINDEKTVISTDKTYEFDAYGVSTVANNPAASFANPHLTAKFEQKKTPAASDFIFAAPGELTYNGAEKHVNISIIDNVIGMGNITVKYYKDGEIDPINGAPVNSGTYTVSITVSEGERYSSVENLRDESWSFSVIKADQTAPAVGKADEIISMQGGSIINLSSEMEYRAEGRTDYVAVDSDTVYVSAGKYYVRYKADENHNASSETEITVNTGRKQKFTLPQNPVGYTVTTSVAEYDWTEPATVYFELHEGYTKTENFKFMINGTEVDLVDGVSYPTGGIDDYVITVEGVEDNTAPTAQVAIAENKWTELVNGVSFDIFFTESKNVIVTADDRGSGIEGIEYYISNGELSIDEITALTDWEKYDTAVKLDPNNRYVVYVKVSDKAENITYISSNGVVIDDIAPTLQGIENDKTYYGDLTVIKSEEQFYDIKHVTLDGESLGFLEGTYGIIPADNKQHTVIVEDHAGNKTTYVIRVFKNYKVTYKIDGEIVSEQIIGNGRDAIAPAIPEKNGYTQVAPVWDKDGKNITADTEIAAVYTINKYTVTYKADGKVVVTLTVEHGTDATVPAIPEKVGYTDTAPVWDNDGKNITADTEITAVYTQNEPGEIILDISKENDYNAKLNETAETIKDKVTFNESETQRINWGEDVKIWVEMQDINTSISADEKAIIAENIDSDTSVLYLDITMYKQIGTETAVKITSLAKETEITIVLSDEFINKDEAIIRTYKIVHIHDVELEIIDPVFDAEKKTLTFRTDKFSTYAVTYTDTPVKAPEGSSSPDTGVKTGIAVWCAVSALSAVSILLLVPSLKKKVK